MPRAKTATATTLLTALRQENSRKTRDMLAQKIEPPEPTPKKIPTLDGGGRRVTPMLAARFAFAGRWRNAILGQTWLSASDMSRVQQRRPWRQEVELRRENYTSSPVSKLPLDRLSLFAIGKEGDATYLIWDRTGEPSLRQFSGSSEDRFSNLVAYLRRHLGPAILALSGDDAVPDDGADLPRYLADDSTRLDLWIAGLERWGQPIVALAALAVARVALPSLPADKRQKADEILSRAQTWAEAPRGEFSPGYLINRAKPIAPEIDGKRTWHLMHACCHAAESACGYHLERPAVVNSDAVRTKLLALRKRKPAEIARALNEAGLKTSRGSAWRPSTAKSAMEQFEWTMEAARDAASATVHQMLEGLGKGVASALREAVRRALDHVS
jgi:hypothetical protein